MKFAVSMVSVLSLVVGSVWYVGGCLQDMSNRSDFTQEVRTYIKSTGKTAAYLALELSRPHLDDETRGKFLGRLGVLDKSDRLLFLGMPLDSYIKVIGDIREALYLLALRQRLPIGEDDRYVFLQQTPYAKVGDFRQWLDDLIMLEINHGDLSKAHATFADLKGKLDAALSESRKG